MNEIMEIRFAWISSVNVPIDSALFEHRILVPDYGFMHLELIPMLVGFFSYKIATFVQAIDEALAPLVRKT
jgi:hypothetical protein